VKWVLIFVSMFLVELPDKTSLATLSLVSRYGGRVVWLGSAAAMIAQTAIAVLAGRVLSEVPKAPLRWVEILLFLVFAFWLWKESVEKESSEVGILPSRPGFRKGRVRIVAQAFLLVFFAEFLDLTQIATVAYASRFPHHLLRLFVVVAAALVAANSIVVLGSGKLSQILAPKWIQRTSAVIFFGVALFGIGSQIFPAVF